MSQQYKDLINALIQDNNQLAEELMQQIINKRLAEHFQVDEGVISALKNLRNMASNATYFADGFDYYLFVTKEDGDILRPLLKKHSPVFGSKIISKEDPPAGMEFDQDVYMFAFPGERLRSFASDLAKEKGLTIVKPSKVSFSKVKNYHSSMFAPAS